MRSYSQPQQQLQEDNFVELLAVHTELTDVDPMKLEAQRKDERGTGEEVTEIQDAGNGKGISLLMGYC